MNLKDFTDVASAGAGQQPDITLGLFYDIEMSFDTVSGGVEKDLVARFDECQGEDLVSQIPFKMVRS